MCDVYVEDISRGITLAAITVALALSITREERTLIAMPIRKFRDRLIANPELVALYVEQKRRLIDAQISDRSTYTQGKKAFIESVLKLEK